MNRISYISSTALFSRNCHGIMRSSLYGVSSIAWKRGICCANMTRLDSILTRFSIQCFSTSRARASRLPKVKSMPTTEEDSDAFYVVRKGDVVGIYKSLSDCQAQVSTSICDPSVSVYKGHSLSKETEEYLASRGLRNPLYSVHSVDIKDDLFGTLVPCPFQQPDGSFFLVDNSPQKTGSHHKLKRRMNNSMTCFIEFDGACKGNPGKSGAGAILRTADGNVVYRVRQGLGITTNNVAEYQALILGMKYALKKGFQQIRVQGDSVLVCNQVQQLWKAKHPNMVPLSKEAIQLRDMFSSFKITHVLREFNSDADAEANLAVNLPVGEVCEELGKPC